MRVAFFYTPSALTSGTALVGIATLTAAHGIQIARKHNLWVACSAYTAVVPFLFIAGGLETIAVVAIWHPRKKGAPPHVVYLLSDFGFLR
jgi:hypothetical protein